MKLYWSWFINPQKVRFALSELGLTHQLQEIRLLRGEQRDPGFLALNPNGKVPVLQHEGLTLWESNAILAYLGETFGLWPATPAGRGDALRWMFFEACHLQAPIGVFWFSDFVAEQVALSPEEKTTAVRLRTETFTEAKREEAHANLRRFLPIVERQLSQHRWMGGWDFTLTDCCYGPQLDALKLSGWPLADFPAIERYLERIRSRSSWQACEFRSGSEKPAG